MTTQAENRFRKRRKRVTQSILPLAILAFPFLVAMALLPKVSATNAPGEPEQYTLPVRRAGALVYFAQHGSDYINVYDLSSETWQPSIGLNGSITAFDVNEEAIYVALETTVMRLDPDGTNVHMLFEADLDINQVFEFDSFLVLASRDTVRSYYTTIDTQTGTIIDTDTHSYAHVSTSKNKDLLRVYGRFGLNTIAHLVFDTSGHMTGWYKNPDTYEFTIGYGRFVSPNQGIVIDELGNVFNTTDLTRNDQLNPHSDQATDVVFYGELPIIIEGKDITSFAKDYQQTGKYTLEYEPDKMELFGDNLYLFTFNDVTPTVQTLPLSSVTPDDFDAPLDAAKLDFEPDFIEYSDDIVYIYSKKYRSLFRWSVVQERYLTPFHVRYAAKQMALSPDAGLLFLQRADTRGSIDKMSILDGGSEYGIITITHSGYGIAVVDDFLILCNGLLNSYDLMGQLIDEAVPDTGCTIAGYVTSSDQRHIIALSKNGPLKRIDIDNDGVITDYFGQLSGNWQLPVRMLDDERVITGSGAVHDGMTLATLDTLPHPIDDAAWHHDHLFTITSGHLPETIINKWDSNLAIIRDMTTWGDPVYLASMEENLLVVSHWDGQLRYSVWDDELNLVSGTTSNFMLLPSIFKNACGSIFLDDFSDPASGWPSVDTPYYSLGYGNDVYQITHHEYGFWTAVTRGDTWEGGDQIQVKGEVISGKAVWGILFGLNDDWTEFYTFEIVPREQRYYIMRYQVGSGWETISDRQSLDINQSGSNTLEIRRNSYLDERGVLYINQGSPTTILDSIANGRVGLTSGAFNANTTVLYDDYRFAARYCLLDPDLDARSNSNLLALPLPAYSNERDTRGD